MRPDRRAVFLLALLLALFAFGLAGPRAATPSEAEVRALAQAGRLDSAKTLNARRLAAHPGDPFSLFMEAKLNRDGKASFETFQRLLASPKLKGLSAAAASGAGGDGEALQALAEEALYRSAQYRGIRNEPHLAIPFFRENLRRFPGGAWALPARLGLVEACLHLVELQPHRSAYLDTARAQLRLLIRPEVREEDAAHWALGLMALARLHEKRDHRDSALAALDLALEGAPPELRPGLYERGFDLARQGGETKRLARYRKGRKAFAEAVEQARAR